MKLHHLHLHLVPCLSGLIFALTPAATAQDGFPIVPDDIAVTLFAKDPLVRNPCAIAFDAQGRLCVGMGPQYRNPKPDTPGDSVWILTDEDGDGKADARREFATGFNSIQGLAWNGRDLWVGNAPELTVVRDLDGDDKADEYVRVYTDLGNLEHALHGLNVGPDGRIYMSKGNSKGLTEPPNRIAPKPFRDLWGVAAPPGSPDFPKPVVFKPDTYEKNYHHPSDDWGISGGVLRCDRDGSNLEIISRGFRNPWDISFNSEFDWLGTDNDQTQGDKIFSPFFGADFGWGHEWSYDWKGDDHLPTVPSSGPLFEGSGTGVVHVRGMGYPEHYRGIWLVNDWLRRETYIFRQKWDGALLVPDREKFELFAHAGGGRSMGESGGRSYSPTDVEVGPDGAVYIASWGRVYGARYEDGKLANAGRIYRFMPKKRVGGVIGDPEYSNNKKPLAEWSFEELDTGFLSYLSSRKTFIQEELLRRGEAARVYLDAKVREDHAGLWAMWTLGRITPEEVEHDGVFTSRALRAKNLFFRIQSIRICAYRAERRESRQLPMALQILLGDAEPRVRHAVVLAAHEVGDRRWGTAVLDRLAAEDDRVVFYSTWQAVRALLPLEDRKRMLQSESRAAVRRGLLLGLLQEDALDDQEIRRLTEDPDQTTAALATRRLGGKHVTEVRGRPLDPNQAPSPRTGGKAVESQPSRPPAVNPIAKVTASTGAPYRVAILKPGVRLYTDRGYRITKVPDELAGEAFLQTANNDADADSGITVSAELKYPSTLFLIDDARAEAPPAWARDGWKLTELVLEADDPSSMRIYTREVPAGPVTFGTNRDDVRARKGNYIVAVRPHLLAPDGTSATIDSVLANLDKANPQRGSDLFLSRHAANCASCHQLGGIGNNHAPDLSDIGSRADAKFVIESIIDPSAKITEGFAAQMITTKSGANYAGILLEETGRAVTIAMVGGAKVEVGRGDIAERKSLPISAMQAGFGAMLTSAQLADMTAFLLSLTKKPAPDTAPVAGGEFRFERVGDDRLALHLGKTQIATYLIDDPVLTRRAFVNLRTPSGIEVTRRFPAPAGDDHAHMHPGLWIAFGWLSGNDYWRLQSKVAFDKFLSEPKADGGSATFATRNRYLNRAGDETVCTEDTQFQFTRISGGIVLDVDASFYNDERDFAFGDQEESGLAVRMAKPLAVQFGNGRILNDSGDLDGKGTWGKEFKWIDYSGEIDGKRVGVLMLPHPENPRASWSHSRDYGALVANPFPKQPRERREPYVTTPVKKSERYRLRYRVLIHEGAEGSFDPAKAAEALSAK